MLWVVAAAFLRRCEPDQVQRVFAHANLSSLELPQLAVPSITVKEFGREVNGFSGFRLYSTGDTCY
jgi:hypothetical protein